MNMKKTFKEVEAIEILQYRKVMLVTQKLVKLKMKLLLIMIMINILLLKNLIT